MTTTYSIKALFTPLALAFLLVFSVSCSDDDDEVVNCADCPPAGSTVPDSLAGEFTMSFSHTSDGQAIAIATNNSVQPYKNALNQPYNVTKLKYYVSNVKLINSQNGKTFTEPNSYHLIDLEAGKTKFNFTGVPVKSYDKVEFSIGVDSAQNTSIDKKGDLNPDGDMAWTWNTGYIFFKLDGFTSNNKGLLLHVGGTSNYKKLSFPLNQSVTFQKGKPVTANVTVKLDELFHNPNVINFDTVYSFMGGPSAKLFAQNYADGMFNVVSISQ